MTRTSPLFVCVAAGLVAMTASSLPESEAQSLVATGQPTAAQFSDNKFAQNQQSPGNTKNTSEKTGAIGCLIEPKTSSQLAAAAPGVLAEVLVDRGDTVKRGQVVAILDNDVEQALLKAAHDRYDTQAAVNTAKATRDMARQKLKRIRQLDKLSYGAKMELELAEGELAVAESRLQLAMNEHRVSRSDHRVARKQLARRQVVSPIDGVVADRMLNPGERADGRAIMHIIQLNALRVEVIMPASQFGKLRAGMNGEVTPDIAEQPALDATVEQVDAFIDAASGTFRARLAMNNADLSVPAGVRCSVRFASGDERLGKG